MQLFISHSSKDRQWVDLVCKRIETAGFAAYQAEYDHSGIGHDLGSKIQDAIKNSAAMIVLLTKSASESPIVRDEIGFAMGQGTLVVALVTPEVASDPVALGMLNGKEYTPFDLDDPKDGLIGLTDWVNEYVRIQQQKFHARQVADHETQHKNDAREIARLESQNEVATLLLVFAGALTIAVLLSKS